MRIDSDSGKRDFHARDISKSYRYRGNVARKITQIEVRVQDKTAPFRLNSCTPENIITLTEENIKIIAYSLRKINTNPTDPYSILKPDTSSDSPSEKSKGVRLVSAIAIISHKITREKNNIKNR